MSIQSVSSGASAYTYASTQTTQSQQTSQAQQTQQAQPVEKRESRPEERVELREEAPKPVTNALGQQTGSVISVTA